ncbi:MAG: hypothetical protein U9R34_03825 [Nanoarchaeota archaeon]|nr:hypothetical protein [Nanoarchaeota archaeon]
MNKKTIITTIIITLLTIFLASSVSALNLTLEKTGETYATSGTWNYNFDSGQHSEFDNITWEGNEPSNTNIQFKARTSSTEVELSSAIWSSYIGSSGTSLNVNKGRWIEVEAHLSTTDTAVTPILYNFTINYAATTEPIYSDFESADETTNFSELAIDLTNIQDLILKKTGKGKIQFPSDYGINVENEDYNTNVKIEDALIFVNSAVLHSTFNNSATLTFEGVNCNFPYVYYSATASSRTAILAENILCPSSICSNIQCTGSTLTVDVTHFSGYAVNGTANLTIDADDPKLPLEYVNFTAIYMNATGFITGAICNISFSDGSYIMDEQADHYNYTKTFASAQTVEYNVTCEKIGENTVFANDTALINSLDIPEFSTMTLGLGLIAVLAGLIVIRKKK